MASVELELRIENECLQRELEAALRRESEVRVDCEVTRAELQAALDRERSAASILRVISNSSSKLQAVLDTLVEQAVRLCDANVGNLGRQETDEWLTLATYPSERRRGLRATRVPMDEIRTRVGFQALAEERTVHVPDMEAEPAEKYPAGLAGARATGVRTALAAPLLLDGRATGVFWLARREVRPFEPDQIALLETFAAQAVIAIENARLFNELEQRNKDLAAALEQQTAVAGVLQAISPSVFDLQAVLNTLIGSAAKLAASRTAFINLLRQDRLLSVASQLDPEDSLRTPSDRTESLTGKSALGTALNEGRSVMVFGGAEGIRDAFPLTAANWQRREEQSGSAIFVPLRSGTRVLGVLGVSRLAQAPYSNRQVALLETFADQAVIAMENARLLDELRDANRQLGEANAAKSQFLSTMSHELRTPLNAVIGYSELLREEAEDEGLKGMVPDLVRINGAGKHLLSLINNVLDLSKIEAGKMELELQEFAVADLLAEVQAVVPPLVSKNGNRFVLDAPAGTGTMHADKTKLRQCLLNLLSNAAKFTEHGTVTLAVRRSADEAGDRLGFAVSDTGIGIPEEQIGRLFQSFTQAEAGTASRYGGTGLGLSLSREFARLMGGDITVQSRAGVGSTFTLSLPAAVKHPAPVAPLS